MIWRILIVTILICQNGLGQNWMSIQKSTVYHCTPTNQFLIDPFTNDIWIVSDTKVATITSQGQVHEFGEIELGTLWTGDDLFFGFTYGHLYFSKGLEGLYSFDNYNRILQFNSTEIQSISTNLDTVYTLSGTQNMFKYTPNSTIDAQYGLANVKAKNNFLYFNAGVIGRKVGTLSLFLHTDPEYLIAPINDFKFSRNSDTLYVGHTKGINYAYNYDFLDTITPFNTLAMPSSNVLEIEFDQNDNLWAVFGDANNIPFSIAKLNGTVWENRIDNTNSPIDFAHYYGFEIDTLGNMWVADANNIHTLMNSNSPSWLGQPELSGNINLNVYPNPSNGIVTIDTPDIKEIVVLNSEGSVVAEFVNPKNTVDLSELNKGIYLLKIVSLSSTNLIKLILE
jgi:hypothetical protein